LRTFTKDGIVESDALKMGLKRGKKKKESDCPKWYRLEEKVPSIFQT